MPCSKRTPDRSLRRARAGLLVAACALLAGCGLLLHQEPGSLSVRNAQLLAFGEGAQLELGLDCRLSGPMQDALDHGIPITFAIDVRAGSWGSTVRAAIDPTALPGALRLPALFEPAWQLGSADSTWPVAKR
jgi:hypothetical protein